MKEFYYSKKVRFGHTDPAGIVFYPRYFEMINEAIEDWFEILGYSFEDMHLEQKFGVPMVHIEADFARSSRIGDDLDFCLKAVKLGRSSLEIEITVTCKGKHRFRTKGTMANVNLTEGRAVLWPEAFRKIIQDWLPSEGKDVS